MKIADLKGRVSGLKEDIQTVEQNFPADSGQFSMKVGDKYYTDKKEAGTALVELCRDKVVSDTPAVIGEYAGLSMEVCFDSHYQVFHMDLKGRLRHKLELVADPSGNIVRISHALKSMTGELASTREELASLERQLETAKEEVKKPFAKETELEEKMERLCALNALLNIDEKGSETAGIDEAEEPEQETPECLSKQGETL